MTTPNFTAAITDEGNVLLIFDEPQACLRCHVARCVWLRLTDGTTMCFLCTPPPRSGELSASSVAGPAHGATDSAEANGRSTTADDAEPSRGRP
jgi:hypothetical protein